LSFRGQSPASDISVMRVRQQHAAAKPLPGPAAAAAGKKPAGTADDSAVGAATGPRVELRRPATYHGGESVGDAQQQQQQQQGLQGGAGSMSLQHLRRMLLRTQSSRRCVRCLRSWQLCVCCALEARPSHMHCAYLTQRVGSSASVVLWKQQ
jgi:hypothetical protein